MKYIIYILLIIFLVILYLNSDILITKYQYEFDGYKYFILCFYIITLFIVFFLEKGDLNFFTPDKIFIYLFSIMIFPGILFLANGAMHYEIVLFSYLSFFCFICGFYFLKHILLKDKIQFREIIQNRISHSIYENKNFIRLIIILSFLLILVFLFTGNFNRSSALLFFLDIVSSEDLSDQIAVAAYRSEVYDNGVIGSFNIILGNYIATVFLPIFSVLLFVEGRKRKSKGIVIYALCLGLLTIFFSIGTGSRLMTMRIFLYYFVVLSLLSNINMKLILRYGFLAFLFLVLMTSILGRGEQQTTFGGKVAQNTMKSIERIFFSKGKSSLIVYDYYPAQESFENGKTFLTEISGTFSKKESLARKMFYFETGQSGTAGPQTFGEFYANFGFIGQVILAFFTGFFVFFILFLMFNVRRWMSLEISVFAYIFLCFGYMGYSSFFSFKSMGSHVVLIMYLLLRAYSKVRFFLND